MKLSVVVPVHNEEAVLVEFLGRLLNVLSSCRDIDAFEVIVVDDGSTDQSAQIIAEFSRQERRVKLLAHYQCKGQCGALKTGFHNASFDHCLTLDSDLQVYPEDIPRLIREAEPDTVVNGWREHREDARIIMWSSKMFNLLCRLFLASRFRDTSSNFTLFPTAYVRHLPLIRNDHRYLLLIAEMRHPGCVHEVPVRHAPRTKGKSKYSRLKAVSGFIEFIDFFLRRKQFIAWTAE